MTPSTLMSLASMRGARCAATARGMWPTWVPPAFKTWVQVSSVGRRGANSQRQLAKKAHLHGVGVVLVLGLALQHDILAGADEARVVLDADDLGALGDVELKFSGYWQC